jgi:hypothetical protein
MYLTATPARLAAASMMSTAKPDGAPSSVRM